MPVRPTPADTFAYSRVRVPIPAPVFKAVHCIRSYLQAVVVAYVVTYHEGDDHRSLVPPISVGQVELVIHAG